MQHVLRAISGPHAGAVYVLGSRTTIGRASDCDIQILHEGVSRHHAKLTLEDDGTVVVSDLSSDNGTFVDEERVERRVLAVGEMVRVMRSRFVYETQQTQDAQTSIVFRRKVTSGDSLRQTVHHERPITALRTGLAQSLPGRSVSERGRAHSRPQAAAPALSGARPGAVAGHVPSGDAELEPTPETVDEAPRVRRPTPPRGLDTASAVRRARTSGASADARLSPGRLRSRPPEPARGDEARPGEPEGARIVAGPASPGRHVTLGQVRRERNVAPASLAPPSGASSARAERTTAPLAPSGPSGRMAPMAPSGVEHEPEPHAVPTASHSTGPLGSGWTRVTRPLGAPGSMRPGSTLGGMPRVEPDAVPPTAPPSPANAGDVPERSFKAFGAAGDEHEGPPKKAFGAAGDEHEGPPKKAFGAVGDEHEGPPKKAFGAAGDEHEGPPKKAFGAAGVEHEGPPKKAITAEYGALGGRETTERGVVVPPIAVVPASEGDLDAMKTVPSVRRAAARRGSTTPTEEVPRIRDVASDPFDEESHRKTQRRIAIVSHELDRGSVTPPEANPEDDPEEGRVTSASLPAVTSPPPAPDPSPSALAPTVARRLPASRGTRARSPIAYEDTIRFPRPDPREPPRADVPQSRHHATSAEIISALEALLPPDPAADLPSDEARPDARTHEPGLDAATALDVLLEATVDDAWPSDIADLSDADRAELRAQHVLEQADRDHRRREGLERLVDILEYRELRLRALQNRAGDARAAERCAELEQTLQQRAPAGDDMANMRRYHRFVCSIPAQLTHRVRGAPSTATVEIEDLGAGGAKVTFGEYSIVAGETVWLTIDLAQADRSRIPYPDAGTVVMKARVVWAHPRSAQLGVVFAGAPQYDGPAGG